MIYSKKIRKGRKFLKVLIVSSQDLLGHLLGILRPEVEISSIILIDVGIIRNGRINAGNKSYIGNSYDYLPECLNELEYDWILLNLRPYGADAPDGIAIKDIENAGKKDKMIHLGAIYGALFNMFPIFFKYITPQIEKFRIFFIGDSLIWRGADLPSYSLPALNLAYSSQDIYNNYLLADKLLNIPNNRLKYAVVGIAPWTFHSDTSISSVEEYPVLSYTRLFKDSHNFRASVKDFEDLFIPSFWDYDDVEVPANYNLDNYSNRYVERAMLITERMTARSKFSVWDHKRYPETVKENTDTLRKILELCKNHSVIPILVRPPLPDIMSAFFPRYVIDEGNEIINGLSKEFDFHYLDKTNMPGLTYNDFFDNYHVNAFGARKFSSYMNDFIMNLENKA